MTKPKDETKDNLKKAMRLLTDSLDLLQRTYDSMGFGGDHDQEPRDIEVDLSYAREYAADATKLIDAIEEAECADDDDGTEELGEDVGAQYDQL